MFAGLLTRTPGESNTPLQVELLKYVFLANFLGLPSISVPVGFDASNSGMPIGLMLTGAQYTEDVLLRLARAAESAEPLAPPTDAVDLLA